jgi:hypothetical protein
VTCVEFPQEATSDDGAVTLTHVGVLVWRTEDPEGWKLWAITFRTDLASRAGLYPVLLKLEAGCRQPPCPFAATILRHSIPAPAYRRR